MRILLFVATALLCSTTAWAQTVTLGSGPAVNGTTVASPINRYYESIRYQSVYTAAELSAAGAAAGTITGIALHITGLPNTSLPDFTIRMANVSQSTLSVAYIGPMVQVYGPTDYSNATMTINTWNNLSLSTPFTWDGSSNLLIEWCYSNVSPWSASGQLLIYTPPAGNSPSSRFFRMDGTNACPVTPNMTANTKPQIQLDFTPLVQCSGTPNAGIVSGPSQVPAGVPFVLSGSNLTYAAGITFQWHVSVDGGATWSNLPNATTAIDTFTQTTVTSYRLMSTCDSSGLSNVSSVHAVGIGAPQPCNASFVHYPSTDLFGIAFTSASTDATAQYAWDFGDGNTSTESDPTHVYADTGTYVVCLSYQDALDTCADLHCDTVHVQSSSVVSGHVFFDSNNNGLIDASDAPAENVLVNAGSYSIPTDASGQFTMYLTQGNYAVFTSPPAYYQQAFPVLPSAYGVATGFNDTVAGLDFLLSSTVAVISGKVFHDANQNGAYDSTESGIAGQKIKIALGYANYVYTNAAGDYSFTLLPDSVSLEYMLDPTTQSAWTVTTPGGNTIQVNAAATGNEYGGNDFGVYLDSALHDIGLSHLAFNPPVPGMFATHLFTLYNASLNADQTTVTVHYDSLFRYVNSANTPLYALDSVNRTLTYEVSVAPGANETIEVVFQCDTNAVLTTPVVVTAKQELAGFADNAPANDSVYYQAQVVGSYDPNDKHVSPAGVGPTFAVHPDHVSGLNYTIRFQNTGTWYATNVLIVDTLDDAVLDVASLKPTAESHPSVVQIINGNILRVFFNNIMLPDSNANEPESHGFFSFSIDMVDGLPLGTVVANRAAIYFDFNDPVITNTTFITLDDFLLTNDAAVGETIALYPNPADRTVHVAFRGTVITTDTYEVTDMLGRVLMRGVFDKPGNAWVDVSALQNGVYFLRAGDATGTVQKFTVLHP